MDTNAVIDEVFVAWTGGRITLGEASHALRDLRGPDAEMAAKRIEDLGTPEDLKLAEQVRSRKFFPKYCITFDPQAAYMDLRQEEERKEERRAGKFRLVEDPK